MENDITRDSMDWTHEELLEEVKATVTDESQRPDCMLVIILWNDKLDYATRMLNVGMKCSEMVALLEFQKQKVLNLMGEGEK